DLHHLDVVGLEALVHGAGASERPRCERGDRRRIAGGLGAGSITCGQGGENEKTRRAPAVAHLSLPSSSRRVRGTPRLGCVSSTTSAGTPDPRAAPARRADATRG